MPVSKKFLHVKVAELIPYENNPRINEPAVADTMESIRQCENLDPIEVDENMVILSGHTRMLAMQRLGINETDIVQYTGLTEEQKKKYRILANKTNELAQWDFSKLEKEMEGLDFSGFNFDFDMPEWTPIGQGNPNTPPEVPHIEPQFSPNGVTNGEATGDDPYLPEGYDDSEIEDYTVNQENYVIKRRVIITYLPEQEPQLKAMLGITSDDMKVVYDIDELAGEKA